MGRPNDWYGEGPLWKLQLTTALVDFYSHYGRFACWIWSQGLNWAALSLATTRTTRCWFLFLRLLSPENLGGSPSGAASFTQLGIDIHSVGVFHLTLLCLAYHWPWPRHSFLWKQTWEQRDCGNLLSAVWEGNQSITNKNILPSGVGKRIRRACSSSRTTTRLWSIQHMKYFLTEPLTSGFSRVVHLTGEL